MSPEPLELQILKQVLGDERGQSVFALTTLAGELARLSQQVQQQAQQLQQQQAEPPTGEGVPPGGNPWTGPAEEEAAP